MHLPSAEPPSASARGPSSSTGLMPQRWHISVPMPHVTSLPASKDVSRHTRLNVLIEFECVESPCFGCKGSLTQVERQSKATSGRPLQDGQCGVAVDEALSNAPVVHLHEALHL